MARRKKKKYQWLFADFETCYNLEKINELKATSDRFTQSDFLNQVEGRVYGAGWSWGETTQEIDDNYHVAESEQPLLEFIINFLDDRDEYNTKYDVMRGYFHNLNFDIQFIKNWLLFGLDGYDVDVIGQEKKIYQVKIKNPNTKKEFWLLDSLNILRMKLSQFPEIDGVRKRSDVLEQDMSITRPLDHVMTPDERIYLKDDVRTLAYGVLDYFEDKDWHMTTSSYAFKEFQKELKSRGLKHYFNLSRSGHIQNYDINRFRNYNHHSLVDTPKQPLQVLKRFEEAYKGGQTFVNPKYQEQVLESVKGLDVNSLYPFSFTQCKVPYISNVDSKLRGQIGLFREADPEPLRDIDDLYHHIGAYQSKSEQDLHNNYFLCFNIIMTIELKDEFTFSPVSKGFCDDVLEIYEFIDDKTRGIKHARVGFFGSEYDLENWKIYYNISDCQLVEYFIFDIIKGDDLEKFRGIMNDWSEAKIHYSTKEHYDARQRGMYKLLMNSLTGKFGEKIRDTKTIIEDHAFVDIEDNDINSRMLPMIMSLISFARLYMSQNISKVKDNFVYCDTDSIYIVNKSDEELQELYVMHDTKLGCFDLEKTYHEAIYMKPKTYVGRINDKYFFTVAGCQVKEELYNRYKIKEYLDNDKIIGKKILKLPCVGGVYLGEKDFVFKGDDGQANFPDLISTISEKWYLAKRYLELSPIESIEEDESLLDCDFTYNNVDSTYSSIVRTNEEKKEMN